MKIYWKILISYLCVYGAAFAVTFYLPEVGTERAGNDITGPEPDD